MRRKRNILGYVFFLILFLLTVALYVFVSTSQPKQMVGVKASYTNTTCESLGLKGAPASLPTFLETYKKTYCTDKTPLYNGNNKCYTKTLACSNYRLETPYWCVDPSCYSCYLEEVDLSLCKPGATASMSICQINDAKWKADKYGCDYGSSKLEYGTCSKEGYICKCDDGAQYTFPTAQKNTNPALCKVNPIVVSACKMNDAKWKADKYGCDFGATKLEYGVCKDGYMCKCDDGAKYTFPTAQKDVTCPTKEKLTCDIKNILLPIITAYNKGDYKSTYLMMKEKFLLSNTQTPVGSTACFMPGARVIESGSGYCGNLELDVNLAYGCTCISFMKAEIGNNIITYDYSRIKTIEYCKRAIEEITKITK